MEWSIFSPHQWISQHPLQIIFNFPQDIYYGLYSCFTYQHCILAGRSNNKCNGIDAEIRRALWTRRFGDVEQRRQKIAKDQLGADYDRGGLKLHNTNFRAFKIVLKAQAATLRYCSSFPNSVLAQLEDWSSVCQLKGSGDLSVTKKFVARTLFIARMDVFFLGMDQEALFCSGGSS